MVTIGRGDNKFFKRYFEFINLKSLLQKLPDIVFSEAILVNLILPVDIFAYQNTEGRLGSFF